MTLKAIMQNSTNLKMEWVERIFLLLHGRFGNSFTNKFKLGQLNANGEDAGIANAKATWAHELAGISAERLKAALAANYEHAPSCDAFKAKCVLHAVPKFLTALPAPNNRDVNKDYADNVVKFVEAHTEQKSDKRAWIKRILDKPSNYPDIAHKYAKEAMKESA